MDIDSSTLLAGLLVSSVGFVLFRYGQKAVRLPHLVAGLALMAFPYFAGGPIAILALSGGLVAALWVGVRMGL